MIRIQETRYSVCRLLYFGWVALLSNPWFVDCYPYAFRKASSTRLHSNRFCFRCEHRIDAICGWFLLFWKAFHCKCRKISTFPLPKIVEAPLNIVLYNVLSGPGPSLYGVEPLSYYSKKLIVNWNVAVLPAVFGFLLSVRVSIKQDSKFKKGL